jgi:putative two-component system response regulator
MKAHPTLGLHAIVTAEKGLGHNSFLRYAREMTETHHEKWDGSGYPNGLESDEIPIAGRLMAIADVYDALISKRVYKLPIPHSEAVRIIAEGRGSHFDPAMVDGFLEIQEEFRAIALQFADYDEETEALRL